MTTITFLKGLREIGGTYVKIETEKAAVMFDFGFAVSDRMDDAVSERQGFQAADYVRLGALAADDGVYSEHTAKLLGLKAYGQTGKETALFMSHMHIDHMGGMGLLSPELPVYMSEESLCLYRRLVAQNDLIGVRHDYCVGVPAGGTFTVGDIEAELVPVDHDVIGASGCLFHTPDGTVCYTADYRFHGFHPEYTRAFARRCAGADLLITEGVTVSNEDIDMLFLTEPEEKTRTEYDLLDEMAAVAREDAGKLPVVCFYERNVERFHEQSRRLKKEGRTLVMDARTADYVSAFYPEDPVTVYAPTIHCRTLYNDWDVASRKDLLERPGDYVLQLDYADAYELMDLAPVVSRFIHADGSPLGDYDPSYQKLLTLLKILGIPYEYRGLGGHARPYGLKWMVDTIAPGVLVPLHSFRPEQVMSGKAGRRVLPEPGQKLTMVNGVITD